MAGRDPQSQGVPCSRAVETSSFRPFDVQGYPRKNSPPPLGLPYGPRHSPTAGSGGGAVFYERGAPVGGRDIPAVARCAVLLHGGGAIDGRDAQPLAPFDERIVYLWWGLQIRWRGCSSARELLYKVRRAVYTQLCTPSARNQGNSRQFWRSRSAARPLQRTGCPPVQGYLAHNKGLGG